jgi:DNA-binding CsgD family transcriptional regulator
MTTSEMPELTLEEREVLLLLTEGADGRSIARRLGMTVDAVHRITQAILEKLHVHTRVEAAARFIALDEDRELRAQLRQLPGSGRELVARWLVADENDRDAIASEAVKRRTAAGAALAKLITMLVATPGEQERVLRVLREIERTEW